MNDALLYVAEAAFAAVRCLLPPLALFALACAASVIRSKMTARAGRSPEAEPEPESRHD